MAYDTVDKSRVDNELYVTVRRMGTVDATHGHGALGEFGLPKHDAGAP